MSGTNSYDPDNFDDVAWLEDMTDELDERYGMDNDQSLHDDLGFEDEVAISSAHSKRSRHMTYEYNHQWD